VLAEWWVGGVWAAAVIVVQEKDVLSDKHCRPCSGTLLAGVLTVRYVPRIEREVGDD
jgi:hypothetical protein